jgi:hypothetical protein
MHSLIAFSRPFAALYLMERWKIRSLVEFVSAMSDTVDIMN